jgi:subtilase family serine protease
MLAQALPDSIHPYFKLPERSPTELRAAAAGMGAWDLGDLCAAYSWPKNLAGGGTIAIIELGGGWVRSDVDSFFQPSGLPRPQIEDVPIGAGRNNPNQHINDPRDPDVEVAMDIQIAAAAYSIATGKSANIRVYWADGTDWGSMATAITAAAADGCDVCSISWGSDEANWEEAGRSTGVDYAQQLNAAAQAAANAGMIVFAASGDNDSSDGGPHPANVDLPSSSPFVVGCGGTTMTADGETVWNDNPGNPDGDGTGGGFSRLFTPMPLWQTGAPHGRGRMVPDVAANADPNTGYNIVVHGNSMVAGGTSAVAPLYAGLFAAFGRKLGFVTPQLWSNHTCFNDIIKGDNGFYRARLGPDPCTGLGSPISGKLAQLFNAEEQQEHVALAPAEPTLAEASYRRHRLGAARRSHRRKVEA